MSRCQSQLPASCWAQPGHLEILHEAAEWVVIDKPAGLAVHPGAGRPDSTLANYLLARYPECEHVGSPERPGIVHRLDAGTTGVMVVARTEGAYLALARAFADRIVDKTYAAIVYGSPERSGVVDSSIGRDPRSRTRMTVRSDGRPARTTWQLLAAEAGIAWLSVNIHTGRTHQIRVHLRAVNYPLVGDPIYGEARWRGMTTVHRRALKSFERPALHAHRLTFPDPSTGELRSFSAPLPSDMLTLWREVTGRAAPGSPPPEPETLSG